MAPKNNGSLLARLGEARRSAGTLGLVSLVWSHFWMLLSGRGLFGRFATWMATWFVPPYYGRSYLAGWGTKSFVSPKAAIHHSDLHLGPNVFIDDHVVIFQGSKGGAVELGASVHLYRENIIQTDYEGSVSIGEETLIQARCIFSAMKGSIRIGRGVQVAPNCTFYPYDHGIAPGELISRQPIQTRGDIVIEDDAWLGVGVIVLSGVRIGKGAVIGAGAVVSRDVPDGAIAMGVPARVVKMRAELAKEEITSITGTRTSAGATR